MAEGDGMPTSGVAGEQPIVPTASETLDGGATGESDSVPNPGAPPKEEESPLSTSRSRDCALPITGRSNTSSQDPDAGGDASSESLLGQLSPHLHISPKLNHLNPWEDEEEVVGDFTKEVDKHDPLVFSPGATGRDCATSKDQEDAELYTVDNAITQIGWGWFQTKLLLVVAASKGFIGMQMLCHAYSQHVLKQYWGLSKTERMIMGSSLFGGMLVGAIFWGRLSDAYGRKKVFLLTVLNTFIFGSVSALAPNYGLYVFCRFLLGFGIGGQGPVSIALLLEFTPSYCRGIAAGLVWIGWYVGEAIETLIGYLLNWGQGDYWQQVAVWTSLPPLFFLVAWGLNLFKVPESPRFLLVSGKQHRGWEVLETAAMENKSVMYRHKLVGLTTSKNWIHCVQQDRKASWHGLFTPALLRTTLLLWWIWFVAGYGTYGLMFILPKFFSRKTDQSETNEHLSMMLTSCGAMVGVLIGAWTSENWGRRNTFALGFCGADEPSDDSSAGNICSNFQRNL
eukprot:TRINITY_DN8171_c0_g1_i5.p1 TRINITY_DN8171_c0_g1~~TRINITY_DN8171_c0_g1_i5.p1  ORF type:complete len:509 (-),score=63.59 TRINITY_DN8171_c0_g1_i5:759-2285(-)